MARLSYTALMSLDGYIEDEGGGFEWAAPDEEVHAFVNDLVRPVGTHLYGRGMYEVMVAWETMEDEAPAMRDFAGIWRAADKVVYSTTLEEPSSARTRIERRFDPAAVAEMKASAEQDLSVAGPGLAAHAFRAGLIDDLHLFASPVVVGGGKPALPAGIRLRLVLVEERRFGNGVVHLHYRVEA